MNFRGCHKWWAAGAAANVVRLSAAPDQADDAKSHRFRRIHHRGFTLIEMLMAAAITIVMVMFLSTIFRTISDAVSLGIATSDIIQINGAVTETMGDDSREMVGPLSNGFIVILQKQMENVQLRPNDLKTVTVRSDQIAWVRNVGGETPIGPATPGDPGTFTHAQTSATMARVWYGHVLRTEPDGQSATELGQPGRNAVAANWIFGRQLLFLEAEPTSTVHIDTSLGYPNWQVTGYASYPAAPTSDLQPALSDVFDMNLTELLIYFSNPLGGGAGYPEGPYQLTYGDGRLWCNPDPGDLAYDAWQVAQMHPFFAANVSDIRIDFAGNFDNQLGIDVDPLLGGIKWYSAFYNDPVIGQFTGAAYDPDLPTTYQPVMYSPPLAEVGFIPVDDGTSRAIFQLTPMVHADAAFVFRPLGLDWPQMIRIRYRMHDKNARLTDRDGEPGKMFERIIEVAQTVP